MLFVSNRLDRQGIETIFAFSIVDRIECQRFQFVLLIIDPRRDRIEKVSLLIRFDTELFGMIFVVQFRIGHRCEKKIRREFCAAFQTGIRRLEFDQVLKSLRAPSVRPFELVFLLRPDRKAIASTN